MSNHFKPGRVAAVIATCAVTMLTAAGCSSSGNAGASSTSASSMSGGTSTPVSGASTSSSGASTSSGSGGGVAAAKSDIAKFTQEVKQFPAVKPVSGVKALAGKTVWYVPIGTVPILAAMGNGITDALNAAGIHTHVCDGQFVPTSMATCLNQAASQGAAGVIGGYIDYQLVRSAYDTLVSKKIPVLIAGEAPDGGKTSTAQLGFYDETQAGNEGQKLSLESVIADSNGTAKILYVGVTDSATTRANAAFAAPFIKSQCPGCVFKEIDYNTSSLNKVGSQVSAALISNPDTNYVVNELDSGSPATISGIQSAGFTNKVKLASSSGNLDALQRLKSGNLQVADIGEDPVFSGWRYADGMIRMMTGQAPVVIPGVDRVFTRSNVGGLTLTPAAYATTDWYGSDAYKQIFTKAWGL